MKHHFQPTPSSGFRVFNASLLSFLLIMMPFVQMAAAGTRQRSAVRDHKSEKGGNPGSIAATGNVFANPSLPGPVAAPLLPTITATMSDAILNNDADTKADPTNGVPATTEKIEYTVTIANTGTTDATNVQYANTIDVHTMLVGGSVSTQPITFPDSYNVIGNVQITVPNGASDLLGNDIDPDTGNNTGLTVSALGGDNSLPFAGTSANAGQVTSSTNDGAFAYNPAPGFTGTDTFTYTVTDPTNKTDTQTVTLFVGNGTGTPGTNVIWFIDDSAPAGGDGRLTNPFNCYTGGGCFSTVAADEAGDSIFLFNGTYTGGNVLLNNQKLIGQGASDSLQNIAGVTVPTFSNALPATNNTPGNVTISTAIAAVNAVNLGQGNTLRGFTVGNVGTGGAGIVGTSFGTVTIGGATADVAINSNGQALGLNTGTVANQGFTSVTSTGGVSNIFLSSIVGTVNLGTGTLSGASSNSFDVIGGTVSTTYSGNITKSSGTGAMVSVSGGHTTGSITFQTGTLNASAGTGLQFDNADSTTSYNFNGTTTLNGGDAGIDILNNSGGTFNFSSGTSITNPTGTAFNVSASAPNSVSYAGTITANNGRAVSISNASAGACGSQTFSGSVTGSGASASGILVNNCNSGTINFSGTTLTLSTQGNNGLTLTANAGTTINFSGGNQSLTTTNGHGISGTGGGTVNITGNDNIITTTGSGRAVDWAMLTAVHSNGTLRFKSINKSGSGAKGIVVNFHDGSFTITGDDDNNGTPDSATAGGTITGTTQRGAEFVSVSGGVSLGGMTFTNATTVDGGSATVCGVDLIANDNTTCNAPIHLQSIGTSTTLRTITVSGSAQTGINGYDVRALAMTSVSVTNAGNAVNEHGVVLKNLRGTNTITSSSFTENQSRQLYVINTIDDSPNPTPTLSITSTLFNGSNDLQGALFDSYNSGNIIVNVGDDTVGGTNTFSNNYSNGLQQSIGLGGDMTINIKRNTFTNNNSGIVLQAAGVGATSTLIYTVWNNTITAGALSGSGAIIGSATQQHQVTGDIRGNNIGNGTVGSGAVCGGGCNGITVDHDDISAGGGGRSNITIVGNNVRNVDSTGIYAEIGQKAKGNIVITGNLVQNPDGNTFSAIYVQGGIVAADVSCITATIGGTVNPGAWPSTTANAMNQILGAWDPAGFQSEIFVWRKNTTGGPFNIPGLVGSTNADVVAFVGARNNIPDATGADVTASGQPFGNGASCPLMLALGGISSAQEMFPLSTPFDGRSFSSGSSTTTVAGESNSSFVNFTQPSSVSNSLTQQQLDSIVAAAIERWSATGLTSKQIAAMRELKFEVGDLSDSYLGEASGNRILVDRDAQGKGWFMDATPAEDLEFGSRISATRGYTNPFTLAAGRIDLLTAIEHEIGHRLGLDDLYSEKDRDSIMYGYLAVGERRVPAVGQAANAQAGSLIQPHYLSLKDRAVKSRKPEVRGQKSEVKRNHAKASRALVTMSGETVNVSIGTLAAGDSVTITYEVTVNNPPNLTLLNPARVSNQGTVTFNEAGSPVQTDDVPGGAANPTETEVDLFDTSTNLVSDLNPSNAGDQVTFTATVTETPAQPTVNPTGTVDFIDTSNGNAVICNDVALVAGSAQCQTSSLLSGTHNMQAVYSGDGNFETSTSNTVAQVVNACVNNPVVTKIADTNDGTCDADCSLREAIATTCTGNTITFATGAGQAFENAQTITLTLGELSVARNLTIDAPDGANHVTVSAGGVSRVFNINSGKTVTIRELTITNGLASGVFPANAGGGIYNDLGTLTLINMTVSGNTADFGGGVYNSGNAGSASLTITNSTFNGNTANTHGGAIYNDGIGAGTAILVLNNSTISGNNAKGQGGGIITIGSSSSTTVTTTNVTITNNTADSDDSSASDNGGGLFVGSGPVVRLRNTIVAGNLRGTLTPVADDIAGANVDVTVASSNNLIGTGGTGGLTAINGNQINVANPGLGVLASNGGLTQTHALLFGSPAIEAGDNTFSDAVSLTTDQRGTGFIRKADSADAGATKTVDIGALEAQATIEDITDKTTPEDIQLIFSFNVGDEDQITSVTASSANGTLVPPANFAVTGTGSTRTLTINPDTNQFGTSLFTVTVNSGSESMQDTFLLTVTAVADLPSVTNTSTNEDTQTTTGLVITKNANDGAEVGFFKITSITSGTLFQNDGSTPIVNGQVITEAEGNAGLKFTPAANSFANGSFQAQGATDNLGNGLSSAATATITVNAVADTPSVSNSTTDEDTQTSTNLVILRNAADSAEVTHFKITGITGGTLFKHDGTTQINNGDFIAVAEAADVGGFGLKFTPAVNLFSPTTAFSFTIQASTSNVDGGLGGSTVNATITVNPVADTPTVTNSSTNEDTQTTTGLVISRNAVDNTEVAFFKITSITNGLLFTNDGSTPITNGQFITFAEGNAGLKFTPAANFSGNGTFQVQGSIDGAGTGLSTGFATATITVGSVADVPTVTPATTNEDTQTSAGLVITPNAGDADVTHFKIINITNGLLFQTNGTTPIINGDFITLAQGGAGLKFTPTANLYSSVSTFSFDVQGATSAGGAGLGVAATASITVNPIADTPSVTNSSTAINTQTASGLVISRNAADDVEVTHFKISNITNGALFQNDGTTPINNNDFITFAEGNAGLKFTPGLNLTDPTVFGFDVQASLNNTNGGIGGGTAHATINVNCTSPQVVTSTLDDGSAGTLRYAILNICPVGTITFNLPAGPQTITLGSQLTINKDLTIIGPGSQSVTISGSGATRVFLISNGNVSISNLTISGGGSGINGAGLLNTSTGTVTLTNMTFSGNTGSNGGGIATLAGTMNVYNSTISGNTATGDGGGLYHDTAGTVNVLNSTIFNNNAGAGAGQGGGIRAAGGTTNVRNSIVAGNTAFSNANVGGVIVDQGNNILSGDPKLAPLADNGGPTQTHALKPGSPALDTGDNTAASNAGLSTDQRGGLFARIRDAASDADITQTVDIGAFEADPSVEDIADKTTTEDTALPTFSFNIGDSFTAFDSITGTSSDTNLVPNANITVGPDTASTRTLSITPAANQSGTATITVTVTKTIGSTVVSMSDTFLLTVGTVPDTPSVTNTTTNEDTQSTTGLVITKNVNDGAEVTHFKITNITGGTLFKNDGATAITNNSFITEAEGNAGLKFTPAANSIVTGSFQVRDSTDAVGTVLSPAAATGMITITPIADTPSVTNATTNEDTQTTSGLVISRNPVDGAEVTHFKITGITNGTLFQNNGTTPINNGDFITFAQGAAGLKFTPALNSNTNGSFQVQGATSAAGAGLSSGLATATITVNTVADTPSVTNATTNEDTQTTSGLVISRNAADSTEVTHFKITGITNGTLFQNNGSTPINNGDFITFAQGSAGLKFTPAANLFSPTSTFSFTIQASTSGVDAGLGGSTVNAAITVTPVADTPSVTNATTNEDTQTTSGLVITRNAADSAEVTHFKITAITNGTLFKNNGTTQINNGEFITFAEGNAGLKFTPAANSTTNGSFQVQGATDNLGGGLGTAATATITITSIADTPSVTPATTNEDTQTTSGLVISRNAVDSTEVTHFKITGITNGTLFQNNGTTQINDGDFILAADGLAGLKFTPALNLFSPSSTFSFTIQASTSNVDGGLGSSTVNATITVNPIADTPSVTPATTSVNVQTSSGLVISRNVVDNTEVTHFKITNITGGTLFQNNGSTQINAGDFIPFAEGNAGLKFTPTAGLNSPGSQFSFEVQASTSNSNPGLGGSSVTATITVNPSLSLIVNTLGDAPDLGGLNGVCDTHADPGDQCTLRAAIQETNNAPSADTITFNLAANSTVTLTSALDDINGDLVITGPASGLTVSGDNQYGVFRVLAGKTVSISNLTIANGQSVAGGGIDNLGNLTISNSTFTGNKAAIEGGAIYSDSGTITIINSTISGNSSEGEGGGLLNCGTSTATLVNVTITNNRADADAVAPPPGSGGGIGQVSTNSITLRNTIVAGNFVGLSPSTTPDDIFVLSGSTLNTGVSSNNLIGDAATSGGINDGNLGNKVGVNINAVLNPTLANNGGPTQTHALIAGSPALDAGNNCVFDNTCGFTLTTDQRGAGFTRKADGPDADATDTVDIGAFEAQVWVQDILDRSINEDGSDSFSFNVGGSAAITTVTATSSNIALVPNNVANLNVTGVGSTRTLTINPLGNQSGTTTITVTVNSASGSMTDTFVFTVNLIADTPSVTNGSTSEDTLTPLGQLVISRNPADGAEVSHFKITGITNGTLYQNDGFTPISNNQFITFAQGDAGLRFLPALNSTASGSFTVQAATGNMDLSLGGGTATATISVSAVNDQPTLDAITPNPRNITEDAGLQTVNLTGISDGGAGEGHTLTVTAISNNTSLIPNPTVTYTSPNSTGSLSFTPVAQANGTAVITVTVNDSGGGTQTVTRTLTVNVSEVNDAPTAVGETISNVAEDSGQRTIPFATLTANDSKGPANESGQTLIVKTVSNPVGGTVSIFGGDVRFTPTANHNGPASFQYTVEDNGTTNGSSAPLTSGTATANWNITTVNDPPDAVSDALTSVAEDSAMRTIPIASLLSNDTKGPADENGQTLSLSLVSGSGVGGTVSSDATNVYFTPAADFNGTASFQYTVTDNGQTNGVADPKSETATVSFTITEVNDAPSFTRGPDQTTNDPNPQTVTNWAGNISAGPADESGQTLTFLVSNNNNALFAVQPALDSSGTLTYRADFGADGVATVTVQLHDNGGTALGGVDTSAPQTFTITVHALNNPPTLDALGNVTINEDAPLQTINLSGITPGPIYESSQSMTVTATSNNTALIPNPSVSYTSPNTTGSISFTPVGNANGSAEITVTVKDSGGTAGGGVDTFSRTFTVTVNPINDAPVNSVPGSQNATLNATLIFSAANANLISISDVDAGSDPVQVTLKATDGTLTLSGISGLSFTTGDGTGDPLMTFTGSIANINAALNGMGNLAFGSGVIEITTNDLGHNGAGGALSDTDTIQVTVIDNLAPILLTIEGSDRAIAFDSLTFLIDPFSLQADSNFSADHRTHIMLFALHAQLRPGEDASAVTAEADVSGTVVPLIVESVRTVPNFDWLTQIVVKFPDHFSTGGGGPHDARIRIRLRGQNSNQAVITIVPAPPGP